MVSGPHRERAPCVDTGASVVLCEETWPPAVLCGPPFQGSGAPRSSSVFVCSRNRFLGLLRWPAVREHPPASVLVLPPLQPCGVLPMSTPTAGLRRVQKFGSQSEDSVDGFGESRYFPSVGSSLSTVPPHLRVSPSLSVVFVAGLSEDRSVTFLVQGPPRYLAVLDAGVNEIVLSSLFRRVPSEHVRVPLICAY